MSVVLEVIMFIGFWAMVGGATLVCGLLVAMFGAAIWTAVKKEGP